MNNKTSAMCKIASVAVLVLAAILAFIENKFIERLQIVLIGLLIVILLILIFILVIHNNASKK